jgi:hypothetical protein
VFELVDKVSRGAARSRRETEAMARGVGTRPKSGNLKVRAPRVGWGNALRKSEEARLIGIGSRVSRTSQRFAEYRVLEIW